MDKLGSWVDPTDVVDGGNQYQHGVQTGVQHHGTGAASGFRVHTLDAILVAPITTQPPLKEVCPGSAAAKADVGHDVPANVSCSDIWCTWQGTPTALPGGGTRGARLAAGESVIKYKSPLTVLKDTYDYSCC